MEVRAGALEGDLALYLEASRAEPCSPLRCTRGGFGTGLASVGAYVLAGDPFRAHGDHEVAYAQYEAKFRRHAKVSESVNAGSLMAPPIRLGLAPAQPDDLDRGRVQGSHEGDGPLRHRHQRKIKALVCTFSDKPTSFDFGKINRDRAQKTFPEIHAGH